jgi:hypothetical protein
MKRVTEEKYMDDEKQAGKGYGQSESMMGTLEEASRLLNAYARAILTSSLLASISRRDIKGRVRSDVDVLAE